MMKKACIIFLFVVGCLALCAVSYADRASSTTLIENAKDFDNKIVVFQGEVIGDVMIRGDFAWVNLNDGQNALGIWMPRDFTKDIIYKGSYKAQGDLLEVEGVFHRACPEHGGDMDIHAQVLKKIQSGQAMDRQLDKNKLNIVLTLAGVLCLILILQALKKK